MSNEKTITPQFSHSVKIETNAKGLAQVSVHVYANSLAIAKNEAIDLYTQTIADLKDKGVKVAEWQVRPKRHVCNESLKKT
jgi:hypothetical protein